MTQPPIPLTPAELADFERDGFLLLRDVLSPQEVERYLQVVDALESGAGREHNLAQDGDVEIRNAIALAPELLELLDHPRALGAMLQILGWNIQLTTSHVFVRQPTPEAQGSFKAIGWHADGPSPSFPIVNGAWPRMYAKIGFLLTDLSIPDSGNLRVIPGSHLSAQKPALDERGEPVGALQVLARAGDAVLFENRTWHAVGPNYADYARKNIYMGYCHRYLKAIDFQFQSPKLVQGAGPIQKQLLGACSNPLSFYLPDRYAQDVPLRELQR